MSGVTDLLVAVHNAPAHLIQHTLLTGLKRHRGKQPPADDLTLVVLKKPSSEAQNARFHHYFHFYGQVDQLPLAEKTIMQVQGALPDDPEIKTWLLKVQLAFVEAVSNIFIHAYKRSPGQIQGLLTLDETQITIDMVDVGKPFPSYPTRFKQIDLSNPPEHGYGLPIINQVMDSIEYKRLTHEANYWRFTARLPRKESS
jgi:anti-sigma regulatory factor (Ser/Thr protein kinase)